MCCLCCFGMAGPQDLMYAVTSEVNSCLREENKALINQALLDEVLHDEAGLIRTTREGKIGRTLNIGALEQLLKELKSFDVASLSNTETKIKIWRAVSSMVASAETRARRGATQAKKNLESIAHDLENYGRIQEIVRELAEVPARLMDTIQTREFAVNITERLRTIHLEKNSDIQVHINQDLSKLCSVLDDSNNSSRAEIRAILIEIGRGWEDNDHIRNHVNESVIKLRKAATGLGSAKGPEAILLMETKEEVEKIALNLEKNGIDIQAISGTVLEVAARLKDAYRAEACHLQTIRGVANTLKDLTEGNKLRRRICENHVGAITSAGCVGYLSILAIPTLLYLFTFLFYDQARRSDRCRQLLKENCTDSCDSEYMECIAAIEQNPLLTEDEAVLAVVLYGALVTVFTGFIEVLHKSDTLIEGFCSKSYPSVGARFEALLVFILIAATLSTSVVLLIEMLQPHTTSFLVASGATAVSAPLLTALFTASAISVVRCVRPSVKPSGLNANTPKTKDVKTILEIYKALQKA